MWGYSFHGDFFFFLIAYLVVTRASNPPQAPAAQSSGGRGSRTHQNSRQVNVRSAPSAACLAQDGSAARTRAVSLELSSSPKQSFRTGIHPTLAPGSWHLSPASESGCEAAAFQCDNLPRSTSNVLDFLDIVYNI